MMHLLEKLIYPLKMESGANSSGLPTPGILVPILHIGSKRNEGLYPSKHFIPFQIRLYKLPSKHND